MSDLFDRLREAVTPEGLAAAEARLDQLELELRLLQASVATREVLDQAHEWQELEAYVRATGGATLWRVADHFMASAGTDPDQEGAAVGSGTTLLMAVQALRRAAASS